MEIAIMGGAFDPPHIGHRAVIESILAMDRFSVLHIIPSSEAPHKEHVSPSANRLEMCRLAFGAFDKVKIDDREIRRKGVSYTYLTLRELRAEYPKAKTIALIVGYDWIDDLQSWKNWTEIRKQVELLVVKRPSETPGDNFQSTESVVQNLQKQDLNFSLVDNPMIEVSSSGIRGAISRGEDIKPYLSAEIHEYVRSHKLY